jgi:hypothetical protein
MGYYAKVIADSIAHGVRLTTLEIRFPRPYLAEFNTHRVLSRNSASSRAIPVEKRLREVLRNPYIPEAFGANKKGMQAGAALPALGQWFCRALWLFGLYACWLVAWGLSKMGAHKQWANRPIELWSWHVVVVTATEWENFFNLRISPEAQPEMRIVAGLMKDAMDASTPCALVEGQWHLPYYDDDLDNPALFDLLSEWQVVGRPAWAATEGVVVARVSSARCGRVSYLTHDGRRVLEEDIGLADRLQTPGHMSPFEHAAKVATRDEIEHRSSLVYVGEEDGFIIRQPYFGNFRAPWFQYRKMLPNEAVYHRPIAA